MNNGDTPATALIIEPSQDAIDQASGLHLKIPVRMIHTGLTKREAFAMNAQQGLLTDGAARNWTESRIAEMAVTQADALLKELEK